MAQKILRWKLPIALFCVLVAATLGSMGCGTQKVDTSKSVYKIGAVLSLSGPAAPLGQPEPNSLKMLESQLNAGAGVNGHKVRARRSRWFQSPRALRRRSSVAQREPR